MKSEICPKGFNRLNFEEMKRVGAMVGFDVTACARHKKSCGPGCDWLARDKRYYTLMLLKHLDALMDQKKSLPVDVLAWHEKAKDAAREYAAMEERMYPILKRKSIKHT
ncbi:MAG: hypothetical protein JW832_01410 [Deltaproteobacteria bacterium]|nr:hypothetical protein [Deltaproteobacteria bacterium]